MIINWTTGATDQAEGLNVWTYTSAPVVIAIHRTITFSQDITPQIAFTQSVNTDLIFTVDIEQ